MEDILESLRLSSVNSRKINEKNIALLKDIYFGDFIAFAQTKQRTLQFFDIRCKGQFRNITGICDRNASTLSPQIQR
jgi:hypothetical protein